MVSIGIFAIPRRITTHAQRTGYTNSLWVLDLW